MLPHFDHRPAPSLQPAQLLSKLLVNACVNPLTALLHCRNGGLLDNAPAQQLMAAIVAECRAALGGSETGGLAGSDEELMARVEQVVAATSGNLNSMLQDVVKGAATEIDFLNG